MLKQPREDDSDEGLVAKGRTWKKNNGRRGRSKSKFRGNNKSFECKKEWHFLKLLLLTQVMTGFLIQGAPNICLLILVGSIPINIDSRKVLMGNDVAYKVFGIDTIRIKCMMAL